MVATNRLLSSFSCFVLSIIFLSSVIAEPSSFFSESFYPFKVEVTSVANIKMTLFIFLTSIINFSILIVLFMILDKIDFPFIREVYRYYRGVIVVEKFTKSTINVNGHLLTA